MEAKMILIALAVKYKGNWNRIYQGILDKEEIPHSDILNIYKDYSDKAITIIDKEYPTCLKNIQNPPFVIFYKGDISLMSSNAHHLAVVGSRKPTNDYANKTKEIVSGLDKEIIIVSGLAKGIDAIAHQSALDSGKKTIAVLGNSINYYYPEINRQLQDEIGEKGLIISEFPYDVGPDKDHFPVRNRIIAGLSKAIFVPQAFHRSGTLITVGYGLEIDIPILCLPSSDFNESACNQLIKEGAFLVENKEEVEDFLRR